VKIAFSFSEERRCLEYCKSGKLLPSPPHPKKSLGELDNIAAGGAEAFESFSKILDDLKDCGL